MSSADAVAHAPAPAGAEASGLDQYLVPGTTSLQERRPLTLKHGDTFGVFDRNGDIIAGPGSPDGLYHRDTRYLSHFFLTLDGARPMLLSSTLRDDNATLTCDLTNPDLFDGQEQLILPHDLVHLRRSRFLWQGKCFERISLRSFDEEKRTVRLLLDFSADFADLFEVRGTHRERRGTQNPARVDPASVALSYTGLDKVTRTTTLSFDPKPQALTARRAVYEVELPPRETHLIFIEISCGVVAASGDTRRRFFVGLRDARRALRYASSRAASVATSNDVFNEAARRSISDIYTLITEKPEGPYPYAGIPWFSTVFGRDAIVTALQMLWIDPKIAKGVLRHLAANQATTFDGPADAEPGKILHEVRHGEMAELGEVPFRRYYGSIDSTPLFVMLAGAYLERTGDLATTRTLWPHVLAALAWQESEGDRDGDGFIEYGRRTSEGLVNQGWKDSHDSIFHADGTLARGPIALAEVQAYGYGALVAGSQIAHVLGEEQRAAEFAAKAAALRTRFDEAFFDRKLDTYVLALDGDKRPCRVRASNAGHVLYTGLALPERALGVVSTLMDPTSFSGWGVRTIANVEKRYNPMSYHNGSVWPHDNALIAAGFARYGFRRQAARIFQGLFAASTYIELRRLPELFCGFPKQRSNGPTFYPVACSPQAWAAATPLSLLQSCIGVSFRPGSCEVVFDRPVLPDFLHEVTLRGLSCAEGEIDVLLRQSGEEVVVSVLRRSGGVGVVTHA
ncbi:amylo-alpha-1,6-glucosidase [Starkeya sp. ORNL1]|uniref:amylo-alpha-1,6-glucosidase n=1 Tax=Starkeya sp. ORNL1 TaxID=2709380 RepID=UPI0014642F69|nr:amylo-alpha-1,6-glucosidase [Starkeya sp. ORNL1]QJP17542.1 amylo-alpha-1,6-glucosidase [Starkeya sp. ORNL1]